MGTKKRETPDFFDEDPFDPVRTAIGSVQHFRRKENKNSSAEEVSKVKVNNRDPVAKKKAGFYLSMDVLDRFTRKFHELKLEGVTIENKSALVEAALNFALDDIDMGEESKVLKKL